MAFPLLAAAFAFAYWHASQTRGGLDLTMSSNQTDSTGTKIDMESGLAEGAAAPRFSTHLLNAETISLDQFKGKKIIVNLWASWCPPCVEEMPSLIAFAKTAGVPVIAISADSSWDAVVAAFKKNGWGDVSKSPLKVAIDTDGATAKAFGTSQFPETFAIDGSGAIARKFIGAIDWNSNEIREWIKTFGGQK